MIKIMALIAVIGSAIGIYLMTIELLFELMPTKIKPSWLDEKHNKIKKFFKKS
jgi:hypothetical protein